jgi:membrane protein implicated in regulation of membrane protease activity
MMNLFSTITVSTLLLSSMQFLVFLAIAMGGLIFLGFAVLFGHHDDVGVGHDVIGHHGGEGHSGDHDDSAPSFLSPRIFFAFITGFGIAGAIATLYGQSPACSTLIGFIPGFIMAFCAWSVAYYLFKEQVNSNIRPGQVVGALGTVVTTIPVGGLGEVNVSVNNQILPYTALSEDAPIKLLPGTRIKVTRDYGDKVVVKADIN